MIVALEKYKKSRRSYDYDAVCQFARSMEPEAIMHFTSGKASC